MLTKCGVVRSLTKISSLVREPPSNGPLISGEWDASAPGDATGCEDGTIAGKNLMKGGGVGCWSSSCAWRKLDEHTGTFLFEGAGL